jgi:nickel-dependent lactate racemase
MNQSTLFCAQGSEQSFVTDEDIQSHLVSFLEAMGPRDDVLIIPPDYTRLHSQAGKITRFICEYYNFIRKDKSAIIDQTSPFYPNMEILPALGTHAAMTPAQIHNMFGAALASKEPNPFIVHDWRRDVKTIGYVPSEMVRAATHGLIDQEWPAQLNKRVWSRRYENCPDRPLKPLILSIGQVVPHEVMGMANFNKNLLVGVGGVEAINLSHFIGAVSGHVIPNKSLRDVYIITSCISSGPWHGTNDGQGG